MHALLQPSSAAAAAGRVLYYSQLEAITRIATEVLA